MSAAVWIAPVSLARPPWRNRPGRRSRVCEAPCPQNCPQREDASNSGLTEVALDRADDAAHGRIFGAQALDLSHGADDRRVILAAEAAADLGEAHLGELAGEEHGDHARVRDGAVALRTLEIMELDVEISGDLALNALDRQPRGRVRDELRERVPS